METKTTFERLYPLDVSQQTKMLQKQTYLPWPKAWAGIKKECPDAVYKVLEDDNGFPYFSSPLGIIVKTEVTIGKETLPMWRAVYNGAKKAMKAEAYTYQVTEYANGAKTGRMIDKWVEAATTADINDSIMRCLVKNFAMFGYGLHVFKGERSPEVETLDSHQLSEITAYATKHKINLMDLTKTFGVQRVAEIHAYNFENAMQWLNDAVRTDKQ